MTTVIDALIEATKELPELQVMKMEKPRGRTQWKQWLASMSATLSMIAAGTVYGWTTTILSRLTTGIDVPLKITEAESSWIVSLTVIGSMMGPFLGAWLSTNHGRKFCLLFSSLFYIIGWIIVIYASDVTSLYTSRMILGIGVGMSYTTSPMYVSEIADTNIRGALGTLVAVNVYTGSLLAGSVGPWVSYRTLAIVMLVVPTVFILTFVWFPESPYYLASKKRYVEATRAIAFFKGIDDREEADRELLEVMENINGHDDSYDGWIVKFRQLFSNNNRKAFGIVLGLVVAQQLSGQFSTMQYLGTLFAGTHIGMDSNVATIIVLAVGLVSGGLSTMLVEDAGRRPLLVVSTLGSAVTLGILAIYLLADFIGCDVSNFDILPVVDVILFQIAYQAGLGTLPNLLIGELFPTSVKGIAGAAITVSDGILSFTVSKMYQVIGQYFGNKHVVYFIFSGSCFVAVVFVLICVPETKGKSFAEIQNDLGNDGIARGKRPKGDETTQA